MYISIHLAALSVAMARTLSNNGTPDLAGVREIVELARLLKDSGDRVLSASSKLSLSTKLLNNLNEVFSLIINETDDLECSFQVCNSSRNEVNNGFYNYKEMISLYVLILCLI